MVKMANRSQDKNSPAKSSSSSAFADMSILDELFPSLGNGDSSASHFTSQLAVLFNTLNSSDDESSSGPSLYNPLQLSPPRLSEIHALATANLVTQTQEAIMQEYNITDLDLPSVDTPDLNETNSVKFIDRNSQSVNVVQETITVNGSSSLVSTEYIGNNFIEPEGCSKAAVCSDSTASKWGSKAKQGSPEKHTDTFQSTISAKTCCNKRKIQTKVEDSCVVQQVPKIIVLSDSFDDSADTVQSTIPNDTLRQFCYEEVDESENSSAFSLNSAVDVNAFVASSQPYIDRLEPSPNHTLSVPGKSTLMKKIEKMKALKNEGNAGVVVHKEAGAKTRTASFTPPRLGCWDSSSAVATSDSDKPNLTKFIRTDQKSSQNLKQDFSESLQNEDLHLTEDNGNLKKTVASMDNHADPTVQVNAHSLCSPEITATEQELAADSLHKDNILFVCNICAKIFTSMEDMERHSTGHKVYSCPHPDCVRTFNYRSHLSYHCQTHTGEKDFQCALCGKQFTKGQHLEVHLRSHTTEKMFRCMKCSKSFHTAGNLRNHERIHSGDRPYKCDVSGCDKAFAELSTLKKHKVTHTGERQYRCDICGKTFTQSSSRSYHMKKHREPLNKLTDIPKCGT